MSGISARIAGSAGVATSEDVGAPAPAAFIWGTVIDATHSYLPMFVGVIVLMALTIATVVAIGRMQKSNW